jgi:PAS domain S-box-containing protein
MPFSTAVLNSPEKRTAAASTLAAAMRQLRGAGAGDDAHFREIVAHSVKATALIAPDGTILEANELATASLGDGADEPRGMAIWDASKWAVSSTVRQKVRASVAAAVRGVAVRHEVDLPDDAVTIDLSLTPVMDTKRAVVLVVAEWRDVTDRKHAEAALRDSEARFHSIVSIAADAIISVDDTQRISLFNSGAEQIFGYTSEEILGKPLDLLLPRELSSIHAKEVRAFGESADASRRMGQRRQIFGRRKSGEVFSAEASISKAMIGGQRVFTAVLRDVTERWAAEQEKTELLAATQGAREVAERAVRQRDEMLEIVSHDLRNPLSAIAMCAGILANDDTDADERVRLAETIHESVDWTQRLIADLMDIASIEAGKLSIDRAPFDPMVAIARALSVFELPVAEREIRLHVTGDEHLPVIDADAERVLQVLANLIGNAIKFTPAGGTITVSGEVADQSVVFSVRDTGSGIAPEHLSHVFDRRWHAGKPGAHSTGLGLAIARGIVEAHGGRIWVASAPGDGSLFQFAIPVTAPAVDQGNG